MSHGAADFPLGPNPHLENVFQFTHNSCKKQGIFLVLAPLESRWCVYFYFCVYVYMHSTNYSHTSHNFIIKERREKGKVLNLPYLLWTMSEKSFHSSFNFSKSQALQNEMTCAKECCCLAAGLKHEHRTDFSISIYSSLFYHYYLKYYMRKGFSKWKFYRKWIVVLLSFMYFLKWLVSFQLACFFAWGFYNIQYNMSKINLIVMTQNLITNHFKEIQNLSLACQN